MTLKSVKASLKNKRKQDQNKIRRKSKIQITKDLNKDLKNKKQKVLKPKVKKYIRKKRSYKNRKKSSRLQIRTPKYLKKLQLRTSKNTR